MGIKLVLDDHDIDVLEDATGEDFSRFRDAGAIKAFRSRSIETICRVLNREPGDVLKLTDEEPAEPDGEPEAEIAGWELKIFAIIAAVVVVLVLATMAEVALRAW